MGSDHFATDLRDIVGLRVGLRDFDGLLVVERVGVFVGRVVGRFVGIFVETNVGAVEGTRTACAPNLIGHPILLHTTPLGQHMLFESSVSQ